MIDVKGMLVTIMKLAMLALDKFLLFPWAYIAVTNFVFNDYKKEDPSVDPGRLRSN